MGFTHATQLNSLFEFWVAGAAPLNLLPQSSSGSTPFE